MQANLQLVNKLLGMTTEAAQRYSPADDGFQATVNTTKALTAFEQYRLSPKDRGYFDCDQRGCNFDQCPGHEQESRLKQSQATQR
jgi:hypothetical protein